jgi:hypothetical protein
MDCFYSAHHGCHGCKLSCKIYNKIYWSVILIKKKSSNSSEENFLEESFAALIGIIFIYEAFDKMIEINKHRPVRLHTVDALPSNCTCASRNWTSSYRNGSVTINVNEFFI